MIPVAGHVMLVDKLNDELYYYDKGYLRQTAQANAYKLAVKRQMIQIPDKVGTPYGDLQDPRP